MIDESGLEAWMRKRGKGRRRRGQPTMAYERLNPFLASGPASTLTENYCPEDLTSPSCTLVDRVGQDQPGSAKIIRASVTS